MYIDADVIIKASSLLLALGTLGGMVIALYRQFESNKKQTAVIEEILSEQTLICYGLKGALEGLIEHGCNGPCREALSKLEKHLNQSAHHNELKD